LSCNDIDEQAGSPIFSVIALKNVVVTISERGKSIASDDTEYIKSIPNGSESNNLSNFPSIFTSWNHEGWRTGRPYDRLPCFAITRSNPNFA